MSVACSFTKWTFISQASGTIIEGKKKDFKSQNASLVHGETMSSVMTRLQQSGTLNRVVVDHKNNHIFLRNRLKKDANSCQKQPKKAKHSPKKAGE